MIKKTRCMLNMDILHHICYVWLAYTEILPFFTPIDLCKLLNLILQHFIYPDFFNVMICIPGVMTMKM